MQSKKSRPFSHSFCNIIKKSHFEEMRGSVKKTENISQIDVFAILVIRNAVKFANFTDITFQRKIGK